MRDVLAFERMYSRVELRIDVGQLLKEMQNCGSKLMETIFLYIYNREISLRLIQVPTPPQPLNLDARVNH